jgi:predicted metal-dependent phosphotriesterase family hydrolase
MLIMVLMAHGISEETVNMMAKENPAKIFDIK